MHRKPSPDECRLILHLTILANYPLHHEDISKLDVSPLADGGMGSLRLATTKILELDCERMFGEQISDCCFKDIDGTEVIASLYLDQNKELFELDIWKTDFSKLLSIPQEI